MSVARGARQRVSRKLAPTVGGTSNHTISFGARLSPAQSTGPGAMRIGRVRVESHAPGRTLHFEQSLHVGRRLERYPAGRRMDFDESPPEAIATAIAEEIGGEVDYRPVESDGAARAATLIAEMP